MTMVSKCSARRRAHARPIPLEAPVIIAVLFIICPFYINIKSVWVIVYYEKVEKQVYFCYTSAKSEGF
jgi:hypothetical protein